MPYTEEEKNWIWLASIEGVGLSAFYKISTYYKGDLEAARKMLRADVEKIGITAKAQKGVYERYEGSSPQAYLEILHKSGITPVALASKDYPEYLKAIYDPPLVLFCKGDVSYLNHDKLLAVVGTRNPTRYGNTVCDDICSGLAANGVCIVSGLALGIDSVSHKAALNAGAPTVAVLGCGVDVIYPKENKATYEKILENGVIISEYRPGMQPMPGFFPARNRIISGMSRGVLVVEAAEKSGTNITVDYAQSQGREVLAVPGNITSAKSKSPNKLIKEGAAPITSYVDVLEWFGWQQMVETEENDTPSIAQLSMQEMAVIRELEMGEMQFDELLLATDFTQPQLTAMLVSMEIKGIVDRLPGNKYTLKGR